MKKKKDIIIKKSYVPMLLCLKKTTKSTDRIYQCFLLVIFVLLILLYCSKIASVSI